MNVWIRCSKCYHKQYQENVRSFNQQPCPECGHWRADMQMGSTPPEWWTAEDERKRLERKS